MKARLHPSPYGYARRSALARPWAGLLSVEAKDRHGFRLFRLRGLEKVNRAALLVTGGHKRKRRLYRYGRWLRTWTSGATGPRLGPSSPLRGRKRVVAGARQCEGWSVTRPASLLEIGL